MKQLGNVAVYITHAKAPRQTFQSSDLLTSSVEALVELSGDQVPSTEQGHYINT